MDFKAIFEAFLSLVFPSRCAVCRKICVDAFCHECLGKISYCDDPHIIGIYDGVLRSAICALKFKKKKRLAAPLSKLLLPKINGRFDYIVFPPLYSKKERQRGFNQMALIADALGIETGIAVLHGALKRIRATKPQFGLTKQDRYSNVVAAFSLGDDAKLLHGKNILLIDDILTTGATLEACEKCLKNGGISGVFRLVLAHGI